MSAGLDLLIGTYIHTELIPSPLRPREQEETEGTGDEKALC